MIKKFLLGITLSLLILSSCDDQTPHVVFDEADTVKKSNSFVIKDDYEGEIPGMDAKVIDYTLPDPYQHISQLLRDSTLTMSWDKAGFPNAKEFINFFKFFQLDVKHGNKEKVASVVKFPLDNYKSREAFLRSYDSIFAPDFLYEVLNQDPKAMYRDKNGAMAGNGGQMWFKPVGKTYMIIKVNP